MELHMKATRQMLKFSLRFIRKYTTNPFVKVITELVWQDISLVLKLQLAAVIAIRDFYAIDLLMLTFLDDVIVGCGF